MAKPVKCTSKRDGHTLSYKLSTDHLICTGNGAKEGQWIYTMDLRVNEQLDYPDIPPSIWTVTLNIGYKYRHSGQVVASVGPKGNPSELKSPSGDDVMVDCRIRPYPGGVWADFQIGKSGYVTTIDHGNLRGLVDGNRSSHFKLRTGTHMMVDLTFYVKKRGIQADVTKIYDTGMFTDSSLICEGQTFRVHRAILAVQSALFDAMFRNQINNRAPGFASYWMTDIRRDELAAMIKYAYTRAPLDGRVNLKELWNAAHKYGMQELYNVCESEMARNVTAGSAFRDLEFAKEHGLVKLQTAAAKFIGDHPEVLK